MSEDIPRSPCGHQPWCASGDTERLWEKGTHSERRAGWKWELSLGPGLSTKSCAQNLPRSCLEGYVVLLSEARGWVDEGWAVRILRAMCRAVNCQSQQAPPGGEITSMMADPKKLGTLQQGTHILATASQPGEAHLTGESSFRGMFSSCVLTDQEFCFRKSWRERFFRCFRRHSAQHGCLWSFTRRTPKVTPGNLELAKPGSATTGRPP